jgi:radical SAM enzyme (TIGR01210 family)
MTIPALSTAEIRAARSAKASVDPWRPYAYLVEPEYAANGCVEDVATIFLTNRECPWTCVFCDLWRHTLDESTPPGAVPAQIEWALSQLPPAQHVKLYNSGNFFDPQAVPPGDFGAIAHLVRDFRTVIVENHPRLTDDRVLRFRELLTGRLEVALGLETVHPEILPRLNKQMTVADYERAARWLRDHDCDVRTFILIRPPGLTNEDGVEWATRSMEKAFAAGAQCCSLIPTRGGNGAMEQLAAAGWYEPPSFEAMYRAFRKGLELAAGRVFLDLWNVEPFWPCVRCGPQKTAVLHSMNLTQRIQDWPSCHCGE